VSALRLAWLGIRRRPHASLQAILGVAVSTTAAALLTSVVSGSLRPLSDLRTPAALIIGPKSSGLELMLGGSGVWPPSEDRIPYAMSRYLERVDWISHQVPLHAFARLDDMPVFGTDERYVHRPGTASAPRVKSGRWVQASGEAVLGASAAAATGLRVGEHATIEGSIDVPGVNEEEHWRASVRIVGILGPDPSPMNRGVFTDLSTSWDHYRWARAHGVGPATLDDEAVTYLWIDADREHRQRIVELVQHESVAQVIETEIAMASLVELGARARTVTLVLGAGALLLAALTIASLVNARFDALLPDYGVLRALGHGRRQLAVWMMFEAVLLTGPAILVSAGLEFCLIRWIEVPVRLQLVESAPPWPTTWNVAVWGAALLAAVLTVGLPLWRLARLTPEDSLRGV
jgi:putative ABC transport system permease protein